MTEKKPRAQKIPYEIFDEDALAQRFPELVIREFDHGALYKKVKAAAELGTHIPGVRIGSVPLPMPEPEQVLAPTVKPEAKPSLQLRNVAPGVNETPEGALVMDDPLKDVPAALRPTKVSEKIVPERLKLKDQDDGLPF